MSDVLVVPAELQAVAGRLARAGGDLAVAGAEVVALGMGLPLLAELQVGPGTAGLGLRLERLAAELTAEATRQETIAVGTAAADALPRSPEAWSRLVTTGRFAVQAGWTLAGRVVPFYVNAALLGYRLERRGDVVVVRGRRLAGPGLLRDWIRRGRLPGTRYVLPGARVEEELLNFTPGGGAARVGRAAWRAVTRDAWEVPETMGVLRRGGGLPAQVLALGPDAWDYGWGPHRSEGIWSTGFASTLATDLGIDLGELAVSAGAGAAVGSLGCPVAGTAVGFGVGLALGLAVDFTPGGRAAKATVQRTVKQDLDLTATGAGELAREGEKRMYPGFPAGRAGPSPWTSLPAVPG